MHEPIPPHIKKTLSISLYFSGSAFGVFCFLAGCVFQNNIAKNSLPFHFYASMGAAGLGFVGFLMAAWNAIRNLK